MCFLQSRNVTHNIDRMTIEKYETVRNISAQPINNNEDISHCPSAPALAWIAASGHKPFAQSVE